MWKFTQDRWVVRKEVAAVTKVSDFFLTQRLVLTVGIVCRSVTGAAASLFFQVHSVHYCWLAVLLTKAHLHFGTGIDALYRIISSSSHSYSSTGHDCPCSWATGMRLCPLFCFGGKLNILWIRLTKHQSRRELMQSTLILRFCRVRYRSTTLLIALQSCQYWIKALKQLRHLNILSEGKKLFV